MADIPRRTVARSARLASLPLGMAGRATLGLGKRIGGRPAEMVTAELQQRTAEQMFQVLGQLKGGAMKVGQAMSIFEAALPEEVAGPYRAALTKLQDAAPAMPAAQVEKVLVAELGPGWRSMFREFDLTATASASIGQVHRATWSDGRDVAVKLQYPGAGPALMSDLNQMARLARMWSIVSPGLDVKPLIAELRHRVGEELDYRLEAASTAKMADGFRNDPDIAVPELVHHTERAIVTTWLEGTALSKIITGGSQTERDHAGLMFVRFLYSAPGKAGLLHADPHPGNYRLTPDGRFGVLDFGAVAQLPNGMPEPIGRLLRYGLQQRGDELLEGLRSEGFVKPNIAVDPADLLAYLTPFLEPMASEEFTFSRRWLQGLTARVSDPRNALARLGLQLNLPPDYLLVHRVTLGGIGVLCQLNATGPFAAEVARWQPGMADDD